MSVKPEDFEKAIANYLENYVEDIEEEVKETTDTQIRKAKQELVTISPKGKSKRSNPYYRGWAVRTPKKGKHRYSRVIWNKTNYQLTHLLEFGHAKKDGTGWVEAQPHIRPTEEKYRIQFTESLISKIRRQK